MSTAVALCVDEGVLVQQMRQLQQTWLLLQAPAPQPADMPPLLAATGPLTTCQLFDQCGAVTTRWSSNTNIITGLRVLVLCCAVTDLPPAQSPSFNETQQTGATPAAAAGATPGSVSGGRRSAVKTPAGTGRRPAAAAAAMPYVFVYIQGIQ